MADSYIDNNSGSKKKYLIPLVVLMICAVSLTGAGYAYSNNAATLDVTDSADAEYLNIDFQSGQASAYYTATAVEVVDFYDHIVYTSATPSYALSWAAAGSKTVGTATDADTDASTVDVAMKTLNVAVTTGDNTDAGITATKLKMTIHSSAGSITGGDKTIALTDIIKSFTVKIGSETKQITNYTTDNGTTEVEFTITAPSTSTPTNLEVLVTANVAAGNTGAAGTTPSAVSDEMAAAFEALTFTTYFVVYEADASSVPSVYATA